MSRRLEPKDIEKRIKAWADVTMRSLELKHSAMRKRRPELAEEEIKELVRKELTLLKIKEDEQ